MIVEGCPLGHALYFDFSTVRRFTFFFLHFRSSRQRYISRQCPRPCPSGSERCSNVWSFSLRTMRILVVNHDMNVLRPIHLNFEKNLVTFRVQPISSVRCCASHYDRDSSEQKNVSQSRKDYEKNTMYRLRVI